MAVLFSSANGKAEDWERELRKFLPNLDFRVYPDRVGDPADIEFAMVWRHPAGDLNRYRNLKAILSLGAGVEHILSDPDLPAGIPLVRLVDELLTQDMAHHAVHWALHFHRNYHLYPQHQKDHRWERHTFLDTSRRNIGILGLGEIGREVARMALALGFPVSGWSRTPKEMPGIATFGGAGQLDAFLAQAQIVVVVLPRTADTENMLNRKRLAKMPEGGYVINIGRGSAIVDADLIALLDEGHLAGAQLDVFHTEPLPAEHPYWDHPKVFVTPHIAGPTNQRSAARTVARNIERVLAGLPPSPIVDRKRGY